MGKKKKTTTKCSNAAAAAAARRANEAAATTIEREHHSLHHLKIITGTTNKYIPLLELLPLFLLLRLLLRLLSPRLQQSHAKHQTRGKGRGARMRAGRADGY